MTKIEKVYWEVQPTGNYEYFIESCHRAGLIERRRSYCSNPLADFCHEVYREFPLAVGVLIVSLRFTLNCHIGMEQSAFANRFTLNDLLNSLNATGGMGASGKLKKQENALIEYISKEHAYEFASYQKDSRGIHNGYSNYSRPSNTSEFVYHLLVLLASAMAYRPMRDIDRVDSVRNIIRIKPNGRMPDFSLYVYAAFTGLSSNQYLPAKNPVEYTYKPIGKHAAFIDAFYPHTDEDAGAVAYWKWMHGEPVKGRCDYLDRQSTEWKGIDWYAYKDTPEFLEDYAKTKEIVAMYYRSLEIDQCLPADGDLSADTVAPIIHLL